MTPARIRDVAWVKAARAKDDAWKLAVSRSESAGAQEAAAAVAASNLNKAARGAYPGAPPLSSSEGGRARSGNLEVPKQCDRPKGADGHCYGLWCKDPENDCLCCIQEVPKQCDRPKGADGHCYGLWCKDPENDCLCCIQDDTGGGLP